jgi:hypothetical protein
MSHKVNLVRVLTAATGNSTPITLGTKYSNLFMTPAEAGAMDGRVYTYLIVDGNDFELGRGAYTASGTSLARTTVLYSRIAGTLGTSRITLSGTAQVRFIESAEDMDGVRGTRAVTGTSDTLNNSDLGFAVTYSNASAVVVSLAQASVSNLFLDGWAVWVKNKGAGAVTITPATSTIDGAATLVLAQNQGALIWSDGTNYQSFKFRGDLGSAAVRADTDFVRTDAAQSLTATQQAQARANAGIPAIMRSYLAGLTLSTAGSSSTFGIASGVAVDSTNVDAMTLASGYTKTTSAWAVGSGNGSIDTGTIANNTWYHVHLIKRPDTGVVDVLISLSATAPTLPTNYTLARRIGSMRTNGSAQWTRFTQTGDEFVWAASVADASGATVGTTSSLVTMSSPPNVKCKVNFNIVGANSTAATNFLVSSPDQNDVVSNSNPSGNRNMELGSTVTVNAAMMSVVTNTSSQIRVNSSQPGTAYFISTFGWIDRRGRDD